MQLHTLLFVPQNRVALFSAIPLLPIFDQLPTSLLIFSFTKPQSGKVHIQFHLIQGPSKRAFSSFFSPFLFPFACKKTYLLVSIWPRSRILETMATTVSHNPPPKNNNNKSCLRLFVVLFRIKLYPQRLFLLG